MACRNGEARGKDGDGEGPALPAEDLHTRNMEIGKVLLRARLRANKSMKECAEAIGSSRQRYAGFESGKVFIGAVELEALMRLLQVPPHEVWPADLLGDARDIVVQAKPGETVRVVINVASNTENRVGG
jgi:hypothetical protein